MQFVKTYPRTLYTATGSIETLMLFDVTGVDVLSMVLTNTHSTNPLTAFELWVAPTTTGVEPRVRVKNSSFTTPDAYVVSCSGDPTTLAAGNSVIIDLDVSYRSLLEIKVNASSGTTMAMSAGGFVEKL